MFKHIVVGAIAGTIAFGAGFAQAQTIRDNWVPGNGEEPGQFDGHVGDMWTFVCPAGGKVDIVVNTLDDTGDGHSTIDPVFDVYDGNGNHLQTRDDDFPCLYEPVCGFTCPEVYDLPCGNGAVHSLVVRDSSTGSCVGGGRYRLSVHAYDINNNQLFQNKLKLGGGQKRRVPKWFDQAGIFTYSPALDDEEVP